MIDIILYPICLVLFAYVLLGTCRMVQRRLENNRRRELDARLVLQRLTIDPEAALAELRRRQQQQLPAHRREPARQLVVELPLINPPPTLKDVAWPAPKNDRVDQPAAKQPAPATPEDQYLRWCEQRLADGATEDARVFEQARDQLEEFAAAFVAATVSAAAAETAAAVLERKREEVAARAIASFDRAIARPEISRVEITEYGWLVVTTPLSMKQGERTFELGKIEAHIGRDGCIRLFNQARRMKAERHVYDHPLVRRGFPLMPAAARNAVAKAVVLHDIDGVVMALVPFLTLIPNETLIPPSRWPEEKHEERRQALVAEV